MTRSMQPAAVEQFGQAPVLRAWDIASPGPGQIPDKREACGVCHTDLHAARGEFPAQPERPFILAVPLFDLVSNCITLRGSFVGTRQDMVEALAFAAGGQVQADIELQPLSAINHVFDRLGRGEVASRVVLDFTLGDAGDRPSSARWS